jgi:hypothetical protein
VVEGKDYKLILPRCSVMNQAHFRFHNEPFNIVVFEANVDEICDRPGVPLIANDPD